MSSIDRVTFILSSRNYRYEWTLAWRKYRLYLRAGFRPLGGCREAWEKYGGGV